MSTEERERRIHEIARRLAERLSEHWPEEGTDVVDLETFAERAGRDVEHEVSEIVLGEVAERKDGNQCTCACGGKAFYRRHHGLDVVTAAGRQRLRRAYYYCEACKAGFCPADRRLGLGPANTTPVAQARIAVMAAMEPYVQVNDVFAALGVPIRLDVKSTERVTQAVGNRLDVSELKPHGEATEHVAVSLDGVMYPTRSGYKEARVGVVYEPKGGVGRTPAGEAGQRKEYFATTGERAELVRVVCARARERAGGKQVTLVGDGAAFDWPGIEEALPDREEVLDFFHVMERVSEIARSMHAADTGAGDRWREETKKELLDLGPWQLLRDLRRWQPRSDEARELRRIQLNYFERQWKRMRYWTFLWEGRPIGSGAVEGACKFVVGDRLGRTGMRWQPATADPVMKLRAAILSQPQLDLRRYTAPTLAV